MIDIVTFVIRAIVNLILFIFTIILAIVVGIFDATTATEMMVCVTDTMSSYWAEKEEKLKDDHKY